MELLRITGGERLRGEVAISGSKNAALPVMAASLLTDAPVELRNVPDIEDIDAMASMLRHLGVKVERSGRSEWRLQASGIENVSVDATLTRRMRGSLLLLGALVARAGEASIARPGGDDIGMRRVEQHLEGLRAMGAEVSEEGDAYAQKLWRQIDGEVGSPWFLGNRFSALDIYLDVMSRWRPKRGWFETETPHLFAIARRTDQVPELAEVWKRNFPAG